MPATVPEQSGTPTGGPDASRPAGAYGTGPFDAFHPVVPFLYLACTIGFSMAAMQPVYVALSVCGSLASSCAARGVRPTLSSLPWIVLLWLGMAAVNALLSDEGSTVLFELFGRAFCLEPLVYGLCAGGMLASVLLWFACYTACIGSDASLALFGNVAPTVALMVTQVLRLVPQFVSRGREVLAVQRAASAAAPRTRREAASDRLRAVSVLMGWGMEDGLVRGDAMRCRGYESGMRRTSYRRWRMAPRDRLSLAVLALLACPCVPAVLLACGRFSFYPRLGALGAWWEYLPYAVFMALPAVLAAKEWLQWRSHA